MAEQTYFGGENKNIEYKQDIPDDHSKFIKSAVAFANGIGGKLVFGVVDGTLEVTGFNKDEIFAKQDAITNAIYDSCEPKIMPDATVHEINGKSVIVVDIPAGMQTPYYIKSLGMVDGTFIRVSGTTQPADKVSLQELILKGTNRSYDQLATEDVVTEEQAEALCERMYNHAKVVAERLSITEPVRRVGINQLLAWKLLVKRSDGLHPTNGYYLLDGRTDLMPYAVVQCGCFKGSTRDNFIDRKEFDGPIDNQIEEAYNFLLRHLNMETTIEGLYRKDEYELPVNTIRELLANAYCNRSYLAEKKIQVMLYSDRLEITSPGRLDDDLTVDELKTGVSKIRNKALAMAFAYMFLVEGWGTGIPKMYEAARKYGLKEPEIITQGNSFRVNLFRKEANSSKKIKNEPKDEPKDEPMDEPKKLTKRQRNILKLLSEEGSLTIENLTQRLSASKSTIKRDLSYLKDNGFIEREGGKTYGMWVVVKK